jgi:immunoglobulin-binding protein 1
MSNQGSSSSLTLPALFSRTLKSLIPIFTDELSTSLPTVQDTLHNAITDLDLAIRMMATLGVFSDNEEMEDVGDSELVYMTVEWIKAEVQGRINGDGIKGRLATLESSKVSNLSPILLYLSPYGNTIRQSSYESFLFLLESYSFPTPPGLEYPSSSTSSSSSSASPRDPAARREAKIKQYRLEKEWKDKVGVSRVGSLYFALARNQLKLNRNRRPYLELPYRPPRYQQF